MCKNKLHLQISEYIKFCSLSKFINNICKRFLIKNKITYFTWTSTHTVYCRTSVVAEVLMTHQHTVASLNNTHHATVLSSSSTYATGTSVLVHCCRCCGELLQLCLPSNILFKSILSRVFGNSQMQIWDWACHRPVEFTGMIQVCTC